MDEVEFFLSRAARSLDVDDAGWFVFISQPDHYAACPGDLQELLYTQPSRIEASS